MVNITEQLNAAKASIENSILNNEDYSSKLELFKAYKDTAEFEPFKDFVETLDVTCLEINKS